MPSKDEVVMNVARDLTVAWLDHNSLGGPSAQVSQAIGEMFKVVAKAVKEAYEAT